MRPSDLSAYSRTGKYGAAGSPLGVAIKGTACPVKKGWNVEGPQLEQRPSTKNAKYVEGARLESGPSSIFSPSDCTLHLCACNFTGRGV